jgi:hydroxypyruvate isomerase
MSGKNFSGIVDVAMHDVYKENLEYAAKVLEENGIIGLIEPICQFAVPNYYMNSFTKGTVRLNINCNKTKL